MLAGELGDLADGAGGEERVLAAILGVVPRAITPQIDVLEQAGLVRRRTDPHNRRSILLELSDEGTSVAGPC